MANKGTTDEFANMAIIGVTEAGANTLTFKKLETGISLSEKVAWIINRIEYTRINVNATNFNGDNDSFSYGLSVSNAWVSANIQEPTIIDYNVVFRRDIGAAATGIFLDEPKIKDFASMPGGGIIVPPVPLWGYAVGGGLGAAMTVYMRLWYTLLQLSVDQYWELVEARRVISS